MACREKTEKSSLLRIVRTPEGNIVFDSRGRMNGRGAYICRKPECLAKIRKTDLIKRSLGFPASEEVLAEIEKEISHEP